MKNEKRAVLLYTYESSVIYTVLDYHSNPSGKTEIPAEIINLSDSGMRIRIEGRILDEGICLG